MVLARESISLTAYGRDIMQKQFNIYQFNFTTGQFDKKVGSKIVEVAEKWFNVNGQKIKGVVLPPRKAHGLSRNI